MRIRTAMVKGSTKHYKRWERTFRFRLGSFRLGRNFSLRRFSITEAALLLLTAYIASKGLGVIRQGLFNSLFGTGVQATAYYAAFRLPDTIFNLIAGGALTHAFIPVLFSYEKDHGKMEVWRLSSLVLNVLLVALAVSLLLAEIFAPAFVNNILVPGLPPNERALTTTLTRIMLLQPLILGVGTIATALLHSKRQFFPSALAIAIYDIGPIGGILLARAIPGVGIYGPAFGLLVSALLQVAVQIPAVMRQGVRYTFTWNLKNPGLREIMLLLGPNILNVIVASAGAIVITYYASYLRDRASIAVMHNAYMLFALPLTLVGQTIGNALLPQITMEATQKRYVRLSLTVLRIVSMAALLGVAAGILLYFFGRPAIRILFQYGAFSAHAADLTHLALIGYAVGLPGQLVSVLLVLCFYAIKDARTPLFANIIALAVQIGATLLLLRVLKGTNAILTLPLAASLSGTVQAIVLGLILYVRLSAKVKTDRGMQRLRQWRMHVPALQERESIEQAPTEHQPAVQSQGVRPLAPAQTTMQFQRIQSLTPAQPAAQLQEMQPLTAAQTAAQNPAMQPLSAAQAEATYRSFLAGQTTLPGALDEDGAARENQAEVEHLSVAEYSRMVLLDPGNLVALVRWHIAMMASPDTETATLLEVLNRICRQLRGGEQSNYAMAVHAYTQAARSYPDNPDIYFALGQIHQGTGNYDKAIDAYEMAMRDSAVEVMARFSAAQCLLVLERPEAAVQQLEQALENVRRSSKPIDPVIWAARPREEGEEHLAPEVEISMLLARAYRQVGRQEDTQAVLRQVKQIVSYGDEAPPTLMEITVPQGNGNGNLQQNALNVLNEVARMVPQDPRPHDELANIYVNRGLLNEAIAELRDLAVIYLRNNQMQQAGATMRRIGKIHAEVGDVEEALLYLHHASELAPGDLNLLHEVVGLCYQLGRTKEAARYQEKIVRQYLDTSQVIEAVAALQQLIVIDPDNYEAYDLLGHTYASTGEYEQAIRLYKNLARLDPESSIARNRLVELREMRKSLDTGTGSRI